MKLSDIVGQFVAGMSLVLLMWISMGYGIDQYRRHVPASEFFVASVMVPDFNIIENPLIIYNRTIKADFIGSYHVEVKGIDGTTVCRGGDDGIRYAVFEELMVKNATFDWYIGEECRPSMESGQYFLETTYTINLDGYPTKYMTTISNIFEIIQD